jgi:hypothetical protein
MKRLPQLLLCLLACVSAVPAMADGRGHGGWHGGGGYVGHYNGGYHGGGGYGYRGGWGNNWVGPMVGAALLGGAIYAASTPSYAVQPQIVVTPQPYAVGPRVAYFCSTAQAYYPQVPTCQVPWQVVNY